MLRPSCMPGVSDSTGTRCTSDSPSGIMAATPRHAATAPASSANTSNATGGGSNGCPPLAGSLRDAISALRPDLPAVLSDHAAADRQPEPGALVVARIGRHDLGEAVEDVLQLVGG